MPINDGGPAFPSARDMRHIPDFDHEPGMTLRDYVAIKAMPKIYDRVQTGGFARVAELAYQLADAMLAAREAPGVKS